MLLTWLYEQVYIEHTELGQKEIDSIWLKRYANTVRITTCFQFPFFRAAALNASSLLPNRHLFNCFELQIRLV